MQFAKEMNRSIVSKLFLKPSIRASSSSVPKAITSRNSGSSVLNVSGFFLLCKRTGPISDGCLPSRLFSNNRCWYVIVVILYFPIFNVGSTVNGRYSIGLHQKYLKSLSYRSVAKIKGGSTNISDESCFFVVRPFLTFFLNSILWIISDRLFLQPATL